ncbi:MAG TPA: hypothetical protein VKS78_06990 [Roseiarcus sp.]|nr:hypothetical protein [Roseiarcus sp.]
MLIEIVVERGAARVFHRRLKERFERDFPAAKLALRAAASGAPAPAAIGALLAIERLTYLKSRETFCDRLPEADIETSVAATPDMIIDFSSIDSRPLPSVLTLRPLFDGVGSEAALIGALLDGRAPQISIENVSTGEIVGMGVPSLETAGSLTEGMEAVYSRLIPLVIKAARDPQHSIARRLANPCEPSAARAARYAVRNLGARAARALYHWLCYAPHWRVGWRFNDGPGVMELGDLSGPKWNVLPDSGRRCYADPFAVTWQGRSCLFFEDLDHRVGKGVISFIEFGPDGPVGEAVPVIEEPWHLSYPFLIEAEGSLWMIPESSLSGAVPLYRCVEFPRRWERCATLLEGIEAADATVFAHRGRYYMTSVVREGVGGYSDTLAIHHAPSLLGPWRAHAAQPALIDVSAARPAGSVVERSGALWRPVQDCARGYGRALRLARIDRIDPENFAQTLTARIESGPQWPGGRLHTLNRAGRLECIDGVAITPKSRMLRQFANARFQPVAGGQSAAPTPADALASLVSRDQAVEELS